MQIPPNYGPDYTAGFAGMYPKIAGGAGRPASSPSCWTGVGGIRDLNQADGIHPTAKGQEIVAKNVLPYLEKLVEKRPAAVAVGP